ncbi:protein RALF-like 32 [Tripterygium wilfordii]|uniref:protein RALF-like 32 n=1 Tax=Tripterygium wilfordii TaxID=458696 RepID=UPI0018F86068|nr:protein RALF-like 32 [Tripterygium wilfordii]
METKFVSLHGCCFLMSLLFLVASTPIREVCNGSIAECNEGYEVLMESEISRRFLEGKKYISPGALKRDQPVCNGGAGGEAYSKSGCLPPSSNSYNRGCSNYYRCRD